MGVQDKLTLKGYFNTGDVPTEVQFENLIDSLRHQDEPWLAYTIIQFPGAATANGTTQAVLATTIAVPARTVQLAVLFETTGTTTVRIKDRNGVTCFERVGITAGPAIYDLNQVNAWPTGTAPVTVEAVSTGSVTIKLHSLLYMLSL